MKLVAIAYSNQGYFASQMEACNTIPNILAWDRIVDRLQILESTLLEYGVLPRLPCSRSPMHRCLQA